MPFESAAQELFLRINHPEIYRRWKKKYGDAPGFNSYVRNLNKKRRKSKRKSRRK